MMKYFLSLFMLAACSSNPAVLTEKAKDVEVYNSKPTDCQVAGRVVGENKNGSKELALNHALNQAADLKATGIFVNQEVPNGSKMSVHATAYQCH
jgi:uncharacterized protein YcfL